MFRRAKLTIGDIEPEMLVAAARDDGVLVASFSLTDKHGGPRCARVKPSDQVAAWPNVRGSRLDSVPRAPSGGAARIPRPNISPSVASQLTDEDLAAIDTAIPADAVTGERYASAQLAALDSER